MIDLAFTLCEKKTPSFYPMGLAAAYASIRQRTTASLHLHVIADHTVTKETRSRLCASVSPLDDISFYESTQIAESHQLSVELDGKYSRAIIWRAWIADYLKHLDRCLLLDCDVIFNFDVQKIYDSDLGDSLISASLRVAPRHPELHDWLAVPPEKYFRVTCCVLGLKKIRDDRRFCGGRVAFMRELHDLASKGLRGAKAIEQSLFNRYFSDSNKPLPIPLIPVDRLSGHPREREWRQVLDQNRDRILDIKGWNSRSPYAIEFWAAVLSTAWKDQAAQFCERAFRPPEPPRSEP